MSSNISLKELKPVEGVETLSHSTDIAINMLFPTAGVISKSIKKIKRVIRIKLPLKHNITNDSTTCL